MLTLCPSKTEKISIVYVLPGRQHLYRDAATAIRQAFGIGIPSLTDPMLISAIGILVMAIIEASKMLLRRYSARIPA